MESYDDISSSPFESEALPKPRPSRRRMQTPGADPVAAAAAPKPEVTQQGAVNAHEQRNQNSASGQTRQQNAKQAQQSAKQQQGVAGGSRQKAAKPAADVQAISTGITNFFKDGRIAMFAGIVLLVFATYLSIAFISYVANGAADQSVVHSYSIDNMIVQPEKVSNIGGPLGAWLSETLISRSFGLGAIVIIIYSIILGLSLTGTRHTKFFPLTFKSLIALISMSVVLGMVTYSMPSVMFWGGEHGYYINHLLYQSTGIFGMIGVSVILVSAVVLIFFTQLARFFRWIGGHISAARARREKRRMERLAAKEAEERVQEIRQSAATMKREDLSGATPDAEKAGPETHTGSHPEPLEELVDLDDYRSEEPAEEEPYHTPPQNTIEIRPAPVSPLDVLTEEPKKKQQPVQPAQTRPLQSAPPVYVAPTSSEKADSPYDKEEKFTQTAPVKPQNGEVETVTTVAAPIEVAEHDGGDLYDPTAELSHYKRPPLELLHERPVKTNSVDEQEQEENKERITRVLNNFGIEISKIVATVGPTITLYEIVPAEGVRINKIRNLEDDIALSLSAIGIRIIAPMPGKGTIGIEVPNKDAQIVSIRSILSSKKFQETKAELPMAMGATISNEVYIADLTKMPHLLVAGSTGMGKSVGLNTIIASILYKKHPAEVKFVLVDPKMVEFSPYGRLERHYLAKLPDEEKAIITDPAKVVPTLNSLCTEMDNRYELLMKANVRGIKEYNDKFVQRRLNPHNGHQFLPYIIVIIDEFADLIMTAGKEVETPIARIAQKARAVGIHIILATQRPSANIITGVIRANFPGRIAFRVTQMLESRIILDRPGANQLIGRGDMLFSRDGSIERVQCALIDTDEVDGICEWISNQTGYQDAYLLPEYVAPNGEGGSSGGSERMTDRDPLFEAAARMVIESGVGSTTALQRRYNIGFPRAGKIMDQLERAGIVGPSTGGKPRQVLMDSLALDRYLEVCGGNNVM